MSDSGKFFGFLSFVAVGCVGIALFVSSLVSAPKTIDILNKIAYYSAYLCIVLSSFLYCLNKRSLLFWVIWLIAMVFLVLGAFIL